MFIATNVYSFLRDKVDNLSRDREKYFNGESGLFFLTAFNQLIESVRIFILDECLTEPILSAISFFKLELVSNNYNHCVTIWQIYLPSLQSQLVVLSWHKCLYLIFNEIQDTHDCYFAMYDFNKDKLLLFEAEMAHAQSSPDYSLSNTLAWLQVSLRSAYQQCNFVWNSCEL